LGPSRNVEQLEYEGGWIFWSAESPILASCSDGASDLDARTPEAWEDRIE